LASHEDKSESSNKVDEDFSEPNVEEQIIKIQERNQSYLKTRRETIEDEEKAWFTKEINFNNNLINTLKMSLNH